MRFNQTLLVLGMIVLAGCAGGPLPSTIPELKCDVNKAYQNATLGFGFCYSAPWNLEHEQFGPIVSLGTQNVYALAPNQGWTDLAEYKEANLRQLPADATNVSLTEANLGGHPAWQIGYEFHSQGFAFHDEAIFAVVNGVGFVVVYTARADQFTESFYEFQLIRDSWVFIGAA